MLPTYFIPACFFVWTSGQTKINEFFKRNCPRQNSLSLNKSRRRRILALSLLPFCLLLLAFFYFEGSSEIFHVVSWLVPKIAPHSWHNWAGENICEVVVFPFDFFNFQNNTFINISWKYRFYVWLICIMLLQKEFPLFVKQLWKHSPRSIVKASEAK